MTDPISPELKTVMRRLRLGMLLDTLPERLAFARQQKMAHQTSCCCCSPTSAGAASTTRAQRALLNPDMQIERWDPTAKVTYDQELLNELVSMRFVEAHRHVTVVGPVGVGKTFIAHALGHIACRHKYSVLAVRADKLLKTLKHARLDHSHEAEFRKLLAVDVLVINDFGLDAMMRPRAVTCTRSSPSAIAPGRSSSRPIVVRTNGSLRSQIRSVPRRRSIGSRPTRTTW